MSDHVLTCAEVHDFFGQASRSGGPDAVLSEGVQTAFVNMWLRLQRHCPHGGCQQSAECVLFDRHGEEPKYFDGELGKVNFLRSKVRNEGHRAPAHWKRERPTQQIGVRAGGVNPFEGNHSLEHVADLQAEARLVRKALEDFDLASVEGGRRNVAVAVTIVESYVRVVEYGDVPSTAEERRQLFRDTHVAVDPASADGTAAAVRKRQGRMRGMVRKVFEHIEADGWGDLWVPPEPNKGR